MHDRVLWAPTHKATITPTEKEKVMRSLLFLTEKESVPEGCKARHCADGSVQRKWMPPGEASSPTVLTESVFLTSAIDVQEKRKEITLDLPNAFCQTDQPSHDSDGDRTIMRIEGPMVLMLQKIEPGFLADKPSLGRAHKLSG